MITKIVTTTTIFILNNLHLLSYFVKVQNHWFM